MELSWRLVPVGWRLSPSSGHEHVVARTVLVGHQAQLLAMGLIVPSDADVAAVGRSLQAAGYRAEQTADGVTARDPWGTLVSIRRERRNHVEAL